MRSVPSFFFFFQKRMTSKIAAVFLMLAVFLIGPAFHAFSLDTEISIIFTHDMHSHFDAERYMTTGGIAERGGFARMKPVIDQIKADYPNSFLLDAGDFAMGTPYQTIFSAEAPELRMMGLLGFDATTLGNHEFDYRTEGLTDMLNAAMASGDKLPLLVIANIDWDKTMADENRSGKAADLRQALASYGAADYVIIEKGGVKAAVFGILGKQADSYAPQSGLYFKDQIETARQVAAKIRAEAVADIIICLSHSGTDGNPKKSEDELLAAAVPDIDVIISGHTHTTLTQPIVIGNTLIASCGEYTYNIGRLVLARNGSRYKASAYELVPIAGGLPKDAAIESAVQGFREQVDSRYLSRFGYRDRKSTRLNSSHYSRSRMPASA
jgi:2',3'-cyclic-nucleotide 2'-phosphodiesterase (5'-nucleotidase family)